jgi:hypothetical protein
MTASLHDYRRLVILQAARGLIAAARARRRTLIASAPERKFFLGVEAAAEAVVHPELGASRSTEWLDRQDPAFRDGYLETSTLITTAATAADPPPALPLPEPPVGDGHT